MTIEKDNIKRGTYAINSFIIPLLSEKVCILKRVKTLTIPHSSKIIPHIQMKLGTHLPRDNTHVYSKLHNSGFDNYSLKPLFGLKNSC